MQESKFTTSFTDHSHTASVRTVAVNTKGIAASGSADETIKLFDTNKRVEIGSLLQHQGWHIYVLIHDDSFEACLFGLFEWLLYEISGNAAIWLLGSEIC